MCVCVSVSVSVLMLLLLPPLSLFRPLSCCGSSSDDRVGGTSSVRDLLCLLGHSFGRPRSNAAHTCRLFP